MQLYITGRWSSVHSNIVKIGRLRVWVGRLQANEIRNTELLRLDTHDTGNLHNNIKEFLMNNHIPSLSTAYKVSAMNMKFFIAMRVHRSRGNKVSSPGRFTHRLFVPHLVKGWRGGRNILPVQEFKTRGHFLLPVCLILLEFQETVKTLR